MVIATIMVPLLFFGCVFYPWATLGPIRWLQVLTLANPIVFLNEGLRASLTPGIPHMPWGVSLSVQLALFAVLAWAATRGFVRRITT